jgi:hypothetical protein
VAERAEFSVRVMKGYDERLEKRRAKKCTERGIGI